MLKKAAILDIWSRNVLFNDILKHVFINERMVKDHTDSWRGKPLPSLNGLFFLLAARVLLYAPSNTQDSTYHGLGYTSRGALAGTRNSSVGI